MISINIKNLEKVAKEQGLSSQELESKGTLIKDYLEKIHARKQGFYEIIDDEKTVREINNFAKSVEGKYNDIVILGIGGSSLGTICLQQSLTHLFENEIIDRYSPRLHVLDNIDPTFIKQIDDIIYYEKTLFIVVTKSGGTPETLSQYFYFQKQIEDRKLIAADHFVFITDPEKGLLRKISETEDIPTFDIPQNVGGRFSVLTTVGLLPAKLIGINIEELLEGAKKIRDKFLSENFEKNLPFQLASMQFILRKKHKYMNVIIPYSQRLIKFADWYRQLLAESIGKKHDNENNEVFTGITPINALGVTDQHSQSQLYNEGPNDKFFIFIEVEKLGPPLEIPNPYPSEETGEYLGNVTFNQLMKVEKQATEQSLTKNDRPNITIKINEVNEESLGELFMLFEASIAFLGEYYNINAFDQPGVELSKNLTKELLTI
jgi:glucose-6-phosphate isomerase